MGRVTAYLFYEDVEAALVFLARAFGFEETLRYSGPEGYIQHAEMRCGDETIMLGDPGEHYRGPARTGAVTVALHVTVEDLQATFERAKAAGATIIESPADQPYGGRRFGAIDPEGHEWWFSQPTRLLGAADWQTATALGRVNAGTSEAPGVREKADRMRTGRGGYSRSRSSVLGGRLGEQFVDAIARRPSGVIGRWAYRDGPKAHESSFAAVLAGLGPLHGERVLEIGCGPGVLIERVLAAGAGSVAGLDHSADMLALCMARNRDAVVSDRLRLKLADAAQVPWPDQSFDAAISANMLFFVCEPATVLSELRRVLAPGGRLVIATVRGPLPRPSLRNWWLYPPMGPALNVHTDDEMRAMLASAGFTEVDVRSDAGVLALQLAQGRRSSERPSAP